MQHALRSKLTQQFFSALLSLCLLVQPLLLPLHLALAEHTHGEDCSMPAWHESGSDHDHVHAYAHVHAQPMGDELKALGESLAEHDDCDPDHPRHPAEDHEDEAQPQQAPTGADGCPAAVPCVRTELVLDLGSPGLLSLAPWRQLERPPPRRSAQPRAPPAVV